MSDSVKHFRLSDEVDDCGECIVVATTDEWHTAGPEQHDSEVCFLDKNDVLSAPFISSPSEPIYDLSNIIDNLDNEPNINGDDTMKLSGGDSSATAVVPASRKKRSKKVFAVRNVGRWKPADDLLLIISVLQVIDLDVVASIAKFSCKFTFDEIQARWKALLYDELVSRTSKAAIRRMHPEQVANIHRRAPFSLAEEDLLCDLPDSNNPNLDFQNLLEKNSETFYQSRTAKSLQKHWRLLRKYKLLSDQRPNDKFSGTDEIPPTFSDVESEINTESVKECSYHGHVDQEIKLMDQQLKRRTRLLEDELGHWMQLLGISPQNMDLNPTFDSKTFAILRGQTLKYSMQTRFISFGRVTAKGEDVDVDLSIEGPVHKVSRYQGGIELRSNGTFATCNFGKRPFFVDGKPVFPEKMVTIRNNSIFEVFGITLIFFINNELVEEVCFNDVDTE